LEVLDHCDQLSCDDFVERIVNATRIMCLEPSASHIEAAFKRPSVIGNAGVNDPKMIGSTNDKASCDFAPCPTCFADGRAHGPPVLVDVLVLA